MPIKIIKAFQWSPNGYDVATVDAGEHETLPQRAAEIAAQMGAIDLAGDATGGTTSPASPVQAPAVSEPAADEATESGFAVEDSDGSAPVAGQDKPVRRRTKASGEGNA